MNNYKLKRKINLIRLVSWWIIDLIFILIIIFANLEYDLKMILISGTIVLIGLTIFATILYIVKLDTKEII